MTYLRDKYTKNGGFKCVHCQKRVVINEHIGTKNRNHCPHCLWSKHVDDKKAGDRKSACHGAMQPVGLTFKQAGLDKYGRPRQGELMLVHKCSKCGKLSINRIAADDSTGLLLDQLNLAEQLSERDHLDIQGSNIKLLGQTDAEQVNIQLFGKVKF